MTPETVQLYQRGDHYDALFSAEVPSFWHEVADTFGSPILELGCGTGRIAIPLAQAGNTVTGLDASPSMLAEARRKADAAGVHVDWRGGDMRAFDLETRFSLVLLPANALCHLLTRADFTACMACVQRALHPGGRFVVEVFVPDLRLLLYTPEERHLFGEYDDPDGRGHVVVTYSAHYDPATQVRYNRTYYRFPDQTEEEVGELPMRMYFPQELDALFACHGFTLEHKYGGLDRRPFDAAATTQICILTPTAVPPDR
jgi:SAM-dependent methyltransferase